jgi:hypothetical protein
MTPQNRDIRLMNSSPTRFREASFVSHYLKFGRKCFGDCLVPTSNSANEIASGVCGAPYSVANRIMREVRELDHEHVARCRESPRNVQPTGKLFGIDMDGV